MLRKMMITFLFKLFPYEQHSGRSFWILTDAACMIRFF